MNTPVKEDALAVGHRLALEGRNRLTVTGVTEVERFDEDAAALETTGGTLILRGSGLHVEKLDLGSGEVRITGNVDSMSYEETTGGRESFLSRLFR